MMKTIALTVCAFVIGGVMGCPTARAQVLQEETTVLADSTRLEQIVAPIALYPDSLLMQVLMAATYPVEVVEAERLARDNGGLSAEVAQGSLAARDWDPSVKALIGYPDVLKMMSENLDWTRDLGDAFLGQQAALLDAVQRMRQRARDAGTLATTPEQTVTVREDRIIAIEPATTVVYVPTYSPYYAYRGWSCPHWYYPRLYSWWPNYGFSFSVGYGFWSGWGSWFWGRPYWHWGGSSVYVDVDRYNRFNRHHGYHWTDRDALVRDRGDWGSWRHRPEHRRGVRYRDPQVAREFARAERSPRIEAPAFERSRIDRRPSRQPDREFQALPAQKSVPAQRSEPRRAEQPRFERQQPSRVEQQRVERRAAPARPELAPKTVPAQRAEPRRETIRPPASPRPAPSPRVEQKSPNLSPPARDRFARVRGDRDDDTRPQK
jgi:Protein of unknown function (DUF3300)